MIKFLVGIVVGAVMVVAAGYGYVRYGYIDPRADIPIGSFEKKVAMPALDSAVDRLAPDVQNPIQVTDDNLLAGMKVYQTNCAGCHGDVQHTQTAFGDSFYPRTPQFASDAPDMPENQNFYIIQHGVRMSAMPAWKSILNDQQMWQVTTFLSHMDKLPPAVAAEWKTAAAGAPGENSSADASKAGAKDKRDMNMPMH